MSSGCSSRAFFGMGVALTIDITPEAVERLSGYRGTTEQLINALEAMPPRGGISGQVVAAEAAIRLRALSAALTASQAEPAAAYEAAASHVAHRFGTVTVPEAIRALTPANSKAALDAVKAEARADGMREAVDVIYQHGQDCLDDGRFTAQAHAIETANEVLAAIPQRAVKVKPLVWSNEPPYHVARVFGGHYSIEKWDAGTALRGSFVGGDYLTFAEAKAAAQADYTARIMSAIEPTPDPRDEVIAVQPSNPLSALAMRERAADMIETHVVETQFDGSRVVVPSPLAKEDQHHRSLAKAIRALPTTFTNAELLAAAKQLPEVRALVDFADDVAGKTTLACDGGEMDWLILDAKDALAPFTKGGDK